MSGRLALFFFCPGTSVWLSLLQLVSGEVSKLAHESVELFHLPPAFSPLSLTQSALSALIALKPSGEFIKTARNARCFCLTLRTAGGFISFLAECLYPHSPAHSPAFQFFSVIVT